MAWLMSAAQAARELVAESARYAAMGWMRATSGNLSVVVNDDPLRLAVTASGLDKGELTVDDIVEVDAAGRPTGAMGSGTPSAEAALHARLVSATGARAVVHLHTLPCVLAAGRFPGGVVLSGLEMLKALGRPADGPPTRLPVVANSQDMAVLGERAVGALVAGVPVLLVAGHGMYVWGRDLAAARRHAEATDWLCAWAVAQDWPPGLVALSQP